MNDKVTGDGAAIATSAEQWRLMYEQVVEKHECLEREVDSIRKERDAYLKAVYALVPAPAEDIDLEELLRQRGAEPTVDQLLVEIRQRAEA